VPPQLLQKKEKELPMEAPKDPFGQIIQETLKSQVHAQHEPGNI